MFLFFCCKYTIISYFLQNFFAIFFITISFLHFCTPISEFSRKFTDPMGDGLSEFVFAPTVI